MCILVCRNTVSNISKEDLHTLHYNKNPSNTTVYEWQLILCIMDVEYVMFVLYFVKKPSLDLSQYIHEFSATTSQQ